MIIIAIIRIAAGNVSHGQVDAAWAIFWLQVEASVAVMVVSVSAFRALFVARQQASKSRDTGHQIQTEAHSLKASTSTWKNRAHWSRTKSSEGHSADSIELPATQSTTSQAVTTRIQPTLYDDRILDGDRESTSRLQQGAGIWVTKDLSSDEQNVYLGAKSKPSVESFV